MAGGRSYGPICGVYVEGKRCWGRGVYSGRCRDHVGMDDGRTPAPALYRCGWRRSDNAPACCNLVPYAGGRCAMHLPARVAQSDARRCSDIEDKLSGMRVRYNKLGDDIEKVERQLRAMRAESEQREAAE